MKSSHAALSRTRKRLPVLQIMLGVAVLVLVSSALAAGKYLSQGDTDTRSQAAGKQWLCQKKTFAAADCSNQIGGYVQYITTSDTNPAEACHPISSTRYELTHCWEDVAGAGTGTCTPGVVHSQDFCQDPNQTRTNSYVCKCVGLTGGSNGTPIKYGWNCASQDPIKCPVAGTNSGSTGGTGGGGGSGNTGGTGGGGGSGNTGGTGGGGGDAGNTWGPRTIVGQIKCTNVAGMAAPLNQPYAIANVPVRTFWGRSAVPTNVIGSATTNAQGIYSMSLTTESPKFTVRVSNNNQDHDFSFYRKRPSSLAGVTCYDNYAYELCDFLNIAAGTTKEGFDFETNVRAENLRGYQSGTNYVFEFKQANDSTNKLINRYVVRLDNKADGWYNAASDYYLTVPRTDASGIGTCSGGVCKITSAELNAIKKFTFGTYGMGVNPIWNSQKAGQSPVIELCRNNAIIQAQVSQTGTPPLRLCRSGLNCASYVVSGATACRSGNNGTTIYCCPANYLLLSGKCVAPPTP